ncbi:hypothetical protein KSP39_PZI019390 [Platanthera zijinensis]|uniref:Uncharacterized protein n=1 Tax=Platanthera zijinensis TaxID=2320716 RepID=A0AAP0B130_9ASPA
MLQFPAFMAQFPSPPLIPSSTLLPLLASSHNDELLLAMEESELEDRASFDLLLTTLESTFCDAGAEVQRTDELRPTSCNAEMERGHE